MRNGTPSASGSRWSERPAHLVGPGHGLFAPAAAHDAPCSFASVGCSGAAYAMISPIARPGKSPSRVGVSCVQGLAMTCESQQLFDQKAYCRPVPTDESTCMV